MTTYYFVAASEKFLLEEEPLEEVLSERTQNYLNQGKEIDFQLVRNPKFLQLSSVQAVTQKVPKPSAAVISTDPVFIRWLKMRLEYVATGSFEAPTPELEDPLSSLS
jgi:Protein of unknown function (DUF2488)